MTDSPEPESTAIGLPADDQLLASARRCLQLEQDALALTAARLDHQFVEVLRAIQSTMLAGGKLVFSGVGKNVPICQKLTGTFNSTGVPTAFLDPNQALHGDLGFCAKGDLALLISNSGETEDLLRIIPFLRRLGLQTVAITARTGSRLALHCDQVLPYHYAREACPLDLAPTASTTAALAIGDALAMVFLEARGFSKEDFAIFHPAGTLGRSLLLRISEIMRTGERFACAPATVSVQDALLAITRARCGSIALTDPDSGALVGVFSDGDFRRAALKNPDILAQPVAGFMTRNPKSVAADALAVDALRIFEQYAVDDLVAIDADGRPLGIVDGQDMPKLRVV
jgi:arabinose-5-phosphate isomerase